jgi:aminoglycoside 6'-N-acetyltransferase
MADHALLRHWHAMPQVQEWWGATDPYTQAELDDPRVARWIVACNGRPFAFMQDYTVHGWASHHFAHLPDGTRGIDQFIGEPDMIGMGHGSAFILARMKNLFARGAPVIATDPHPENKRAIAVYEKLGFVRSGPPQDTEWGLVVPMLARR